MNRRDAIRTAAAAAAGLATRASPVLAAVRSSRPYSVRVPSRQPAPDILLRAAGWSTPTAAVLPTSASWESESRRSVPALPQDPTCGSWTPPDIS